MGRKNGAWITYNNKEISGDGDINKGKSIQINELSKYVSMNVKYQASLMAANKLLSFKAINI